MSVAGVGVACLGLLLGTAAVASADKQEFLDFIHAQGVPPSYFSTPGADYSNIMVANMVCDVFHNGGTAADIPFLGLQQNAYRDPLIEGAQRYMCPDTLPQ
ncbi:hypothetical protein [Mycobacterium sp. SMC-19]|uniref:hypothetical protein n=1 Tax=Mycobacterium sp. SMC-19 TaxID=3381630 RepID=UPI003876FA3B